MQIQGLCAGVSVVRDEAHCWVSETTPSNPQGFELFLVALIPDAPDAPCVAGVWVGLVCVV